MNINYLKYNKPARKLGLFNRGNRAEQSLRYRQRYNYKNRAMQAVYRAIKLGLLTRKHNCQVCGKEVKTLAHHNNYYRQLDVIWLCYDCHNNVHKILKESEVIWDGIYVNREK